VDSRFESWWVHEVIQRVSPLSSTTYYLLLTEVLTVEINTVRHFPSFLPLHTFQQDLLYRILRERTQTLEVNWCQHEV
jgi:hypothetical protein